MVSIKQLAQSALVIPYVPLLLVGVWGHANESTAELSNPTHEHFRRELTEALIVEAGQTVDTYVMSSIISNAQRMELRDQRLDPIAKEAIRSKNRTWFGVALLPHTKLTLTEQLDLLINQLEAEEADPKSRSAMSSHCRRLIEGKIEGVDDREEDASRYLWRKLESDDVSAMMVNWVDELPGDKSTFLPRLVELSRSAKFSKTRIDALSLASKILKQKAERAEARERLAEKRAVEVDNRAAEEAELAELTAQLEAGGISDVDPNLVKSLLPMAERIIKRYDRDGDGQLSQEELGPMPIQPKAAGWEDDGELSALEYAAAMAKRRR